MGGWEEEGQRKHAVGRGVAWEGNDGIFGVLRGGVRKWKGGEEVYLVILILGGRIGRH
jgi:hypothetical protein